MAKRVEDLMSSLSEYAVLDEDATIMDALRALAESQAKAPAGRQPHRAILVRSPRGGIVAKLRHFAFLGALSPARQPLVTGDVLERAGVGNDLRDASMRMLDLLTGGLVDVCEHARSASGHHAHRAREATSSRAW